MEKLDAFLADILSMSQGDVGDAMADYEFEDYVEEGDTTALVTELRTLDGDAEEVATQIVAKLTSGQMPNMASSLTYMIVEILQAF